MMFWLRSCSSIPVEQVEPRLEISLELRRETIKRTQLVCLLLPIGIIFTFNMTLLFRSGQDNLDESRRARIAEVLYRCEETALRQ
jgi:K+-transporting ATPase A subunit